MFITQVLPFAIALEKSLNEWGIGSDKVMIVVSDNGVNVVKVVTILRDKSTEESENQQRIKINV